MIRDLNPGLILYAGPMFSEKTEELIKQINRYQLAGCKCQVFTSRIDTRYESSAAFIVSHSGYKIPAIPVTDSSSLEKAVEKDTQIIAIDEIQFFDYRILTVLEQLKKTKMIYAAGLDMNFKREEFMFDSGNAPLGMGRLMVIADQVFKQKAVCTAKLGNGDICGAPAGYTMKLGGDPAAVVQVGAKDIYTARCLEHHVILE